MVGLLDDRERKIRDHDCPVLQAITTGVQTFRRLHVMGRANQYVAVDAHLIPVVGRDGVSHGATLLLHDETFIKWKPTVLYWLFGAVLAGSALLFRKNLIRSLLAAQVRLPDPVWARLNWSWVGFFAFMGAANLFVAYNFSESAWVNFKLFGGLGLMLVFVLAQGVVLSRYAEDKT